MEKRNNQAGWKTPRATSIKAKFIKQMSSWLSDAS
jgi:hypothetical protein